MCTVFSFSPHSLSLFPYIFRICHVPKYYFFKDKTSININKILQSALWWTTDENDSSGKKKTRRSLSSVLKEIYKKGKDLELGWAHQSTEGLIFILILLGGGNRGTVTCPDESVIQPQQMCWHESGVFQKYQDSFWLQNAYWSSLSGSLKGGLSESWWFEAVLKWGKVDRTPHFHQTVSKGLEQSNSALLPFVPCFPSLCHAFHHCAALGEHLSQWILESTAPFTLQALKKAGSKCIPCSTRKQCKTFQFA